MNDDFETFLTIFGPRPVWYVQNGDGVHLTGHKQFKTAEEVRKWSKNNINPALYFQVQGGITDKPTRPDANEIDALFAFPIDIDPKIKTRPSTEEERAPCFEVAKTISSELFSLGLGQPMIVDSGNGVQIFIRVRVALPDKTVRKKWQELFRRVEKWVQEKFEDPRVDIDSVADFARVMALIGTEKRKLRNVDSSSNARPFRMVKIQDKGEEISANAFEKFASALPPVPEIESGEIEVSLGGNVKKQIIFITKKKNNIKK